MKVPSNIQVTVSVATFFASALAAAQEVETNPLRDAYFGNLHVHTAYSFDAFTNGSLSTPDDAYRWAQGEAISAGELGGQLKLERPLDFYQVSDHAEYMGVFLQMNDPDSQASELPIADEVLSEDENVSFAAYARVLDSISTGNAMPQLSDPELVRTIWQEVVATADEHYKPGEFTTFPGFEWTAQPNGLNLHRVVVFKSSDDVPEAPLSALDTDDPEKLWQWMDEARANGAEVLAIPHNGNASNGLMFPYPGDEWDVTLDSDYAETRMANEPLYEVTQIKGTSETHPVLSPNDEFASFEIWDYLLSSTEVVVPENKRGSYARQAYLDGLSMALEGRGNPYRFGLIGDSDTHNAASTFEEDNYTGKFGFEASPEKRLDGPVPGDEVNNQRVREFSSAGLAGIWAEANTREHLFEAMQRKEVFATSGPRLKVRFFAGYEFPQDLLDADDWVEQAYARGVPMGGDLARSPDGSAPTFVVYALRDPEGANLDRIQIIKGWVEDGEQHERIYNVAVSGDRQPGADVEPVGNTVNADEATYTNDIGAAVLSATWTDPDFNAGQPAFYYARVIQIPTPRWSTYDAETLGREPRDDLPVSIQERAWTSPIWYRPTGE